MFLRPCLIPAALLQAEGRHYGEASCREYRASVLAALPHRQGRAGQAEAGSVPPEATRLYCSSFLCAPLCPITPFFCCCPAPFVPACSWHSPLDTSLVPAHFEKQRVGSGAQKQQLSKMGALKAKGQGAAAGGGAQQQQHGGAVGGGHKPGSPGAKGAVGNVVSAVGCCWLAGSRAAA